jgi:hypothetical protein
VQRLLVVDSPAPDRLDVRRVRIDAGEDRPVVRVPVAPRGVGGDEGVRWLFSFLSADRRRTYCLYEAPSPEAILAAGRRAEIPADEIVEVGPAAPELSERLKDWANAVLSS